jgi:LuxR family maltose regulon positive regulatory protein
LQLLETGREHRLTLVCAPPGYGKTALLSEWRQSSDDRVFAWLSLDGGDSDPARLWAHLIWAIGETCPELDGPMPLRVDIHPDNLLTGILPLLLDTLATLPGERVIVLDDYHLVDSQLCDSSLDFFLEHLPASVQLVVASRTAPGLPLGRLRGHGQLLELGAGDLRLSEVEAEALAEAVTGAPLPPEDLATLNERCEGWPAGVHLASLLLKHASDTHAVIESLAGDNRYIFDYLKHDLLAGVSDELRTFLRRTSVLSRLSAPLCDAVAGTTDGLRLLREAEQANLFLVPLDDRREWFRYHHLFGDVLRHELEETEPDLVPELHLRAADWHERAGDAAEAIDHAIQSRDVAHASDLVTEHSADLLRAGRILTLQSWLEQLDWPEATADRQLALVRAFALSLQNARIETIEPWLAAAEAGTRKGPLPNGMPSLQFGAALVRALFLHGDVARAAEAAQWAFTHSAKGGRWRLQALLGHGQALYLSGKATPARAVLEQALLESRADAPGTMANVLAYLALIEVDQGDVVRGETLARRAIALLEERGLGDLLAAGAGHLALGVALGAGGAFAEAEAEVERAAELRLGRGPTVSHCHALVLLARARLARGDVAGGRDALDEAHAEVDGMQDVGIIASLLADTERRLQAGIRRPITAGDDLSERELVILRLLAAGLTKPEIASELFIAYNTVKTHTRTIYRKLDASTREEAVARGRELSLL